MRDAGYKSVVSSVILTHLEEKEKPRASLLLEHLRSVYECHHTRHDAILNECSDLQVYVLEVNANVAANINLVIYVYNTEYCKQFTVNSGEQYRFELSNNPNFKMKFGMAKFNGENKKAVVRSRSLLKRIMSLDKKEDEAINLSQIPLNTTVKKSIMFKGHYYSAEIKVVRETREDTVKLLSFDDLLDLTRTLHEYDAQSVESNYNGELCDLGFSLLHGAIHFFGIPSAVLKVATLSVFLVWDSSAVSLDQRAVYKLIDQMKKSVYTEEDTSLLKCALEHLAECLEGEMDDVLARFQEEQLFPPRGYEILKDMNRSLKNVVDICALSLWDHALPLDPSVTISGKLNDMLIRSAARWADAEFHTLNESEKESLVVLNAFWEKVQHNYQSYNLFYHQFNINYIEVTLCTIDENVARFSQAFLSELLARLDSRQSDQLEMFSKCTMKFYHTLRTVSEFAKQHRVENLKLHDYESWFIGATVFWTFSWRELSLRMVERTISLDDDGDTAKNEHRRPIPAALYSFLCIQKGLSDDYSMLSFCHPENLLMGTMALVHIYCENVCAYARKLYHEANINTNEKDSRQIRAVNGMEQAMAYIEERWQTFVEWDRMMSYVEETEVQALEKSTLAVLSSARERCEQLMSNQLNKYCQWKKEEIVRIAKNITLDNTEYSKTLKAYMREVTSNERVDSILEHVDRVADGMRRDLFPRCSQIAVSIFLSQLEKEIQKHLKNAQPSDYYGNVYVTVKLIRELLEEEATSSKLTSLLHHKSFSTEELILSFYSYLADQVERNTNFALPNINLQVGYIKTTGDSMLIVVNVINLSNIPVLNSLYDRVDPYVRLDLLPKILYNEGHYPAQKTRAIPQSVNPTWRQDFQFLVPQQHFFTNGSTLCLSVLDHDRKSQEMMGRTFISMSKMERMESLSLKKMHPARPYALLGPGTGYRTPYYEMLKERSYYDKAACHFLRREKMDREMYLKCLSRKFSARILYRKNKP